MLCLSGAAVRSGVREDIASRTEFENAAAYHVKTERCAAQ